MKKIKLTTRGRYAVMAMIDLAQNDGNVPLPLADIAHKGQISLSYLEQLVAGLRRHGLVKSYRGPGGGYMLAKPSSEIAVAEILLAAEDSTPAKKSAGTSKGAPNDQTVRLWDEIEGMLYLKLRSLMLSDVVSNNIDITEPQRNSG